jgi:biotin transport system substrate-specific component
MRKASIKRLTKIAILVAVLCVGAQISVPTIFLVPITIQPLLVGIVGFLLPRRDALFCLFGYILIGAIGVPVFANFGGGLGTLFGYTGGFIFGFIPLALLCTFGKGWLKIFFAILGVILCHLMGVIQYSIIAHLPFFTSFLTMSLPYIFKDFALVILAYFFAKLVKRKLKRQD